MRIILFAQMFAALTVIAVLAMFIVPFVFAQIGAAEILLALLQFEVAAFVLSAIVSYFLPQYFGVMKGENVLLIIKDPISNKTIIKIAKTAEGGKLGREIKVYSGGGESEMAVVEAYSGIIAPARVRAKPESNIKVI